MDRDQLIQLSHEGKIKYKKKFIQEATEETLERISFEYQMQQLDEINGKLTDILVTKLMEHMELIKEKYKLEKDLSKNELFRKDIKEILCNVTPHCPYIGLISGGLTVGVHVMEKKRSEPPRDIFTSDDTQGDALHQGDISCQGDAKVQDDASHKDDTQGDK